MLQRCGGCAHVFYYPRTNCPACLSQDLSWVEASGRGTIYSYTVCRRPQSPEFADDVPYVLAAITLDEGPRVSTLLVEQDPDNVPIGAPVEVVWDDEVSPELVLTHTRDDAHQDHRLLCELTWNTFRNHLVLEYEVPKWDGDMGRPNVFVPLEETVADRKLDLLLECFPTQAGRPWFTRDLFRGLLRLRGMECVSASGLAEAFYGRKLVVGH